MADLPHPTIPDGMRIYAIGDIHGRADLLADMFAKIDADRIRMPALRMLEVYLGDLIDRGPDSRAVLDLLIARRAKVEVVCLKGNHEELALEFLRAPSGFPAWSRIGGLETLMSYGLKPIARTPDEMAALAKAFGQALPTTHRGFLANLPVFFSCGDFFFVHAGVKPGVPLNRQREADLLWIRDEFLTWDAPFERVIVHGHTPVPYPEFRDNRINIDTGAYATGLLTCLRIEGANLATL